MLKHTRTSSDAQYCGQTIAMTRADHPAPPPPFEAIQGLLLERKDRYRQLRSTGREQACYILGAKGAEFATQVSQAQVENNEAPTEEVSKHAMIRMLAAGYLLPLISASQGEEACKLRGRLPFEKPFTELVLCAAEKRKFLLEAYNSNDNHPYGFSLAAAINFIVSSIEAEPKLLTHRFTLPDNQHQSGSVAAWLLPRLLVASACVHRDNKDHSEKLEELRITLLDAATSICRHACTLQTSRKHVQQVFSALIEASQKASQFRSPSVLQILSEGLNDDPHEKKTPAVAFLWLPEDNLSFELSVDGRFHRLMQVALLHAIQQTKISFPPLDLGARKTVTEGILNAWELDLCVSKAAFLPQQDISGSRIALFADLDVLESFDSVYASRALRLVLAEIERACTSQVAPGPEDGILRLACAFLPRLRSNQGPLTNLAASLLTTKCAVFLQVLQMPVDTEADKAHLTSIYLRKACAWEYLMLSDRAGHHAAEYINLLREEAEQQPTSADFPPWMSTSQTADFQRRLQVDRRQHRARPSLKRKRGCLRPSVQVEHAEATQITDPS